MVSDFLTINGQSMPEPFGFEVKGDDLDSENSTRLENGNMHRDIIWSKARQIACEWHGISQYEAQMLFSNFDAKEFQISILDPKVGRLSLRVYVSKWSSKLIEGTARTCRNGPLWNVSCTFIESSR